MRTFVMRGTLCNVCVSMSKLWLTVAERLARLYTETRGTSHPQNRRTDKMRDSKGLWSRQNDNSVGEGREWTSEYISVEVVWIDNSSSISSILRRQWRGGTKLERWLHGMVELEFISHGLMTWWWGGVGRWLLLMLSGGDRTLETWPDGWNTAVGSTRRRPANGHADIQTAAAAATEQGGLIGMWVEGRSGCGRRVAGNFNHRFGLETSRGNRHHVLMLASVVARHSEIGLKREKRAAISNLTKV